MNPKFVGLSIFAVIVSFIGGFMLANSLNKSEISRMGIASVNTNKAPVENSQNQNDVTLSKEEITARIAEADQNPTNISYQKDLGMALYKYAAMKQDAPIMMEVARLLGRVYESDPKDFEVITTLGNCYFDAGLLQTNDEIFQKSRKFYLEALAIKPNDLDVIADIGSTYSLSKTPDNAKAVAQFEKALKSDPNHERSLQGIIQVYISLKKLPEAEKLLARLEKINPQNPRVPELRKQLAGEPSSELK
jgi:tetratricopeptide (TPR) repeat protein